MKILLVMNIPYFPGIGGANKANRLLAEQLVQRGESVRVVVPLLAAGAGVSEAKLLNDMSSCGIDVERREDALCFHWRGVEVRAVKDFSDLRAYFIRQVLEFQADRVIVSSEDPSHNLLDAAMTTCPAEVIYIVHTPAFLPFGPQAFFPSSQRAKLIERVPYIISVSKFSQAYIQRWGNLSSILFYLPAYGSPPFPYLGSYDNKYITVVNPCRVKGISILLRTAGELPHLKFAAVPGWGTTREDLAEMKALPNLVILEPTLDFDRILASTRILLAPSLWQENFALVVNEAMLRGIPVLASNVGALVEAKSGTDYLVPVDPIETFLAELDDKFIPKAVVPPQDIRLWRSYLSQLTTDRALYTRQSQAARNASHEFFSRLSIEPLLDILHGKVRAAGAPSSKTAEAHRQIPLAVSSPAKIIDVGALTPQARSELILRLKEKAANEESHGDGERIVVVPRDKALPLSFAQRRLWFLDRLEPNSPLYNIALALRLVGRLNIPALTQSLRDIVQRHEALRSTIDTVADEPVQIIAPTPRLQFTTVDLSGEAELPRERRFQALLREEAQTPFDLTAGPLLRARLIHTDAQEHVLALVIHHICADGWSLGILLRELGLLYQAYAAGQESPLRPLPIQYADFAVWQRRWLQGERVERQLRYWRQQMAGAPVLPALPTDRPRPATQSYRGAAVTIGLAADLTAALRQVCHQEGMTLFMVLVGAFQALLHRYSGQSEVLVGTPIANRHYKGTEGLIGLFVNTLALRTNLDGEPPVRELWSRVREVTLGGYDHQDLPFQMLVDELQLERSLSHHPLFQVMIAVHEGPEPSLELDGVRAEAVEIERETTKFELMLEVHETAEGLIALLEYNRDLYERATAERMLEHLSRILEGMVADPDRRLGELPMMSEAEREQVLIQCNRTEQDFPRDLCIHQLFEAQVARSPEAVAVICGEAAVSYRTLNRRANRLAHFLRMRGIGPEAAVGICLERSVEMVTALLAALKAGGAYLPLDAEYPAQRLAYMIENAEVKLLLTQRELSGRAPAGAAEVVYLDHPWEWATDCRSDDPDNRSEPENSVYVIYTSGSTGAPKGTLNTHRSLCNRLIWMQRTYQLGPADRILQKTPFSFDVSVWEFFWPLLSGASLVMARPGGQKDAAYLVDEIRRQQLTVIHFVPSMLEQFLATEGAARCDSLRHVICSGESLSFQLQQRCHEKLPAALHNLYGPTEAAIDVTSWACRRETEAEVVPIGGPIANTAIYLLDGNLEPAPLSAAGELYIGGVGVGRGYLKGPALTAERFIPDRFGRAGGGRLYRTGDLARRRSDGNLEFLGRWDEQVKLRGFRIELGEIEAALRRQAGVKEAVVVMREDVPGQPQLVAYVTAAGPDAVTANGLRERLREELPAHMAPAAFVALAELPLTANGKVDRKALPRPVFGGNEQQYVAPRAAVERQLAEIWGQLLRQKRIGIHDNFFELGGDSILAIQVTSRAARAGLHLTAKQLFQHQTIAGLAAVVAPRGLETADQASTGEAPLTPIQHWFFQSHRLAPAHFNQSLLLKLTRPLDAALWRETLRQLARDHDALRLSFHKQADGWRQTAQAEVAEAPFRRVDCRRLSAAELRATMLKVGGELQTDFDLAQPPLLRTAYFDGGEHGDRLLLVAHHLIVDGVSWRILLEDLQRIYRQLAEGVEDSGPPGSASFRQWAAQATQAARDGRFDEAREYWLAAGRKQVIGLPLDRVVGPNQVGTAATLTCRLSVEQTGALLREAPKVYHTRIDDMLLTALMASWQTWSGARRLLLDLEGHGREEVLGEEEVSLSRTMGWFTSLYPVVLELPETEDWGEKLKSIKEQLRGVPQRGMSYGWLRYVRGDEELSRQLAALPQAEVVFNYLGQFDAGLEDEDWCEPAWEDVGDEQSRIEERSHLLEINGQVAEGQLSLSWTWSEGRHKRETIEQLAANYLQALQDLIAHCCTRKFPSFTLSDLGDVDLQDMKQNYIDEINRAIQEIVISER